MGCMCTTTMVTRLNSQGNNKQANSIATEVKNDKRLSNRHHKVTNKRKIKHTSNIHKVHHHEGGKVPILHKVKLDIKLNPQATGTGGVGWRTDWEDVHLFLFTGIIHLVITIIQRRSRILRLLRKPICKVICKARKELSCMIRLLLSKLPVLVNIFKFGIIRDIVEISLRKPTKKEKGSQGRQSSRDNACNLAEHLHLREYLNEISFIFINKVKIQILAHNMIHSTRPVLLQRPQ